MNARWTAFGVSVPGDAHLRRGRPCEDAQRWAPLPRGVALVVADGLSSAEQAATGAAIAAEAALAAALEDTAFAAADAHGPRASRLEEIVRAARARTRTALTALDPAAAAGAGRSTLGVCLFTPPWVAFAAVGDAFMLLHRTDGTWHVGSGPWTGTGPVNATATLLDEQAPQPTTVLVRDVGIDAVALCTDGLATLLLEDAGTRDERVHVPFAEPLFRHLAAGEDPNDIATLLLRRPDVRSRTEDDRTLLMAVRS